MATNHFLDYKILTVIFREELLYLRNLIEALLLQVNIRCYVFQINGFYKDPVGSESRSSSEP